MLRAANNSVYFEIQFQYRETYHSNSLHKTPTLPVRIEKVLPLPGDPGALI
jgi:hypothetical protein